jgi:hypothetical protein
VFLLVGPSGVGKTEMGLWVADMLFGGERFVVSINVGCWTRALGYRLDRPRQHISVQRASPSNRPIGQAVTSPITRAAFLTGRADDPSGAGKMLPGKA